MPSSLAKVLFERLGPLCHETCAVICFEEQTSVAVVSCKPPFVLPRDSRAVKVACSVCGKNVITVTFTRIFKKPSVEGGSCLGFVTSMQKLSNLFELGTTHCRATRVAFPGNLTLNSGIGLVVRSVPVG